MEGLARYVGEDVFRYACHYAWGTYLGRPIPKAADEGEFGGEFDAYLHGDRSEDDLAPDDVPHELEHLATGDLDLAMALYRAMPCYANLMYPDYWAPRVELLGAVRALLDEPADRLAEPAAYWLWCGPFEAPDAEAAEAWQAVCADPTERRLRRLLDVSGPVPWSAEGPVLEALADDPRWHTAIGRAVRAAAFDVYGRADADAAERLLARLTAPPEDVDPDDLRRRLRKRFA